MDKRKSCVYSRKNKKEYLTNRNIITKRHSDPIHWNRLFSAIDLSFHEKIATKKKKLIADEHTTVMHFILLFIN